MSLDTIRIITEAEQAAQKSRDETAARCASALKEARQAGADLIEDAGKRAGEEAGRLKAKAEEEGKAAAMELVEKTRNQKAVILASAEARMDAAVSAIVDSILKG
ncbi:MAG: hypothetical protein IKH56_06240 [Oscillospiraceae bacterium]|nr:hypothetical protein [Oscillospiraceae bacterium]